MKILIPLVTLIAACGMASAQSLVLDPGFGSQGITHSDPSSGGSDEPYTALLLPDGRILVAGEFRGSGVTGIAMARYRTNGRHDPTFGTLGTVAKAFSAISRARSIAVQSDGKILAAGLYSESNAASQMIPGLFRFNADGSPDMTFGIGGVITSRFDPVSSGEFYFVDTLPGGRIIAAGLSSANINGGTVAAGVQRFLADGTPDSTYGTNGMARLQMNIQGGGTGYVAADDMVVVPVAAVSGANWVIGVARFDSTGHADIEFGDVGTLVTSVAIRNNPQLYALPGPNGTIIVGATSSTTTGAAQFTVVRLEKDGDLDPTFGTGGVVNVHPSSEDNLRGMTLQADGKILLSGSSSGGFGIAGLARLMPNGELDTSFGNGGTMTLDANNNAGTHYAVKAIEQPDGKIVVAGFDFSSSGGDFLLTRLTSPTSAVDAEAIDADGSLEQNAPNPFSQQTTIAYQLRSTSRVSLILFDALGRHVATLVDAITPAGSHTVTLDRGALPTGVYYYRLRTASSVETRRMVIGSR